jgi:hypothetical protein
MVSILRLPTCMAVDLQHDSMDPNVEQRLDLHPLAPFTSFQSFQLSLSLCICLYRPRIVLLRYLIPF